MRSIAAPVLVVSFVMAGCWYVLRPESHDPGRKVVYLDGPAARIVLEDDAEARPGHRAPAFSLVSIDGTQTSLSDFEGKWVLVNFWATWCGPCRQEMPALSDWANAHQPDAAVLAVNLSEDRGTVARFAEEYRLQFPVLLDPGGEAHDSYRVQGAPSTYLVDPAGQVVQVWLGPLKASDFERLTEMTGGTD